MIIKVDWGGFCPVLLNLLIDDVGQKLLKNSIYRYIKVEKYIGLVYHVA